MRHYRRRPSLLLPLLLLLFPSLVCATTTTSKVDGHSTTSSTALIGRIRTLRARLRAVRAHRRNLDRERYTLESSITSAREHIELAALRDARRPTLADNNSNNSNTNSSQRDLVEVNALITAFVSKKEELDRAIALLTVEAKRLRAERQMTLARLQSISLEDILFSRHGVVISSSLPPVMQGAIRKSAHVLTPFFDTLVTVADTNDRLVNHVGAEIDKYTHMGIRASPFMSGMLFYCVALIPAITLVLLVRTFIDSSAKWSVSHFMMFANIYFIASCAILVCASIAQPNHDPFRMLLERYERVIIVCNLIMPIYYCWFIGTLFVESIDSWQRRNFAQLVAASAVGVHYFVFAWSKIFTDKHPQLIASNYLIYATIFAFITYERCARINTRWLTKSPLMRYVRSLDYTLPYSKLSKLSIALPAAASAWNRLGKNLCALLDQLHEDAADAWHRCRHWALGRRPKNMRRSNSHKNESSRHSRGGGGSRGSFSIGSSTWARGRKLSIFSSRNAASEENDTGDESLSSTDSEDDMDRSKDDTHPFLVRLRNAFFRA